MSFVSDEGRRHLHSLLVPATGNDLARYLSYADDMYRRRLFSVFGQRPALLPTFTLHEEDLQREEEEQHLGGTLLALALRDALEDFHRFAGEVRGALGRPRDPEIYRAWHK